MRTNLAHAGRPDRRVQQQAEDCRRAATIDVLPCHPPDLLAVCCLLIVLGLLGPRIGLAAWWIFGDKVDIAFDTWVWPFLGLIFLPWTTIMYVAAWSPIGGVSGAEWLLVALGFVLDIVSYSSRAMQGRF
jgi:hypothetical protein